MKQFLKMSWGGVILLFLSLMISCDEFINAINDNPVSPSLTIKTEKLTVKVGKTVKCKFTVSTMAVMKFQSADTSIATVDDQGNVTGVKEGKTTITLTVTTYDANKTWKNNVFSDASATIDVEVIAADAEEDEDEDEEEETTVAVTGVTLDKAVLRIDKYTTTETLTATVSPAEATDKTVTWKSSDETVATVDASGKITPIKAGTVTIEATAGDKTATSTVYVYDKIYDIYSDIYISINVLAGESYLFTSNGTTLGTKIIVNDGASVTLNGFNITNQIQCDGDATIILADGSTNTVTASVNNKAGIQIGGAGTLTINAETAGTGRLNATGGDQGAGIGTSKNETGGNIVINGGTVTATGGNCAAGIGTGHVDDGNKTCGTITINGGTVTAIGGGNAAGIGTGYTDHSSTNTCGNITIIGGTVIATGGGNAAGIGTGLAEFATNTCGAITIVTDVTSVTATKGTGSPNSIGTGKNDSGNQNCGTIIFGTAAVFNGSAWSPDPMVAGTYGGLTLAISGNTWTLTPAE